MHGKAGWGRSVWLTGTFACLVLIGWDLLAGSAAHSAAFGRWRVCAPYHLHDEFSSGWFEGSWYWLRSPEQEKRVIIAHYNRYCIRCHGVDGRGVWDMPDIPNFANLRWQASRSDAQLARIIVEGRGAVMPAFRGTLTLEEAWAMARYLRSFVPGTETPRPDVDDGQKVPVLPPPRPVKP